MKTDQEKYKKNLQLCNNFFKSSYTKGNELTYIKICSKITNSIKNTQDTFDYKALLSDLKNIRDMFRLE